MANKTIEHAGIKISNLEVSDDGDVSADISYDEEKMSLEEAEEIFKDLIHRVINGLIEREKNAEAGDS